MEVDPEVKKCNKSLNFEGIIVDDSKSPEALIKKVWLTQKSK